LGEGEGEGEAGVPVAEVYCKHGISTACYYQWKSKYAGMSANELKRVKELEAENSRLKRMYAALALENAAARPSRYAESAIAVCRRTTPCGGYWTRATPAGAYRTPAFRSRSMWTC
jgi:putative transposase